MPFTHIRKMFKTTFDEIQTFANPCVNKIKNCFRYNMKFIKTLLVEDNLSLQNRKQNNSYNMCQYTSMRLF